MKKGQAQKKVTSDTNKTSEDTDAPKINYQNFKNSPETTSDLNNPEDLEFVNPLFKTKPRLFNSTIDTLQDSTESLPTEENYDRLVHKLNSTTPTPQKKTSDNKSNEIEMGVKNYGYMNEKERPESWDSTLSVFNPYAVDTPIQRPIDNGRPPSVGMEMSESPPRDRLNTTTKSDYSCISDINPHYVQDKDPQYEDLAGIRAGNRRAQSEWRNAPVVGHKKANILYEPAVITQKTSYQKRTSVDTSGSAYKEHSSCCHLIFTILVGVLAIIALVLIFLLVFGVVSAKKCKECDINNVQLPKSSKQTGSDDVNLQLSYIKGNLTLLQSVLHGNTSVAVVTLQKELDQQKALVADLRIQLDAQKKRSEGIENQVNNFTYIREQYKGARGDVGFDGEIGIVGPAGLDATTGNLSKCTVDVLNGTIDVTSDHKTVKIIKDRTIQKNEAVISAECSSSNAYFRKLTQDNIKYKCICEGVSDTESHIDCTMHLFYCVIP